MKNTLIDIKKMNKLKSRLLIVEERTSELKGRSENYSKAAEREKEMEIMKQNLRDMESRMRKTS